MKRQLILIFAAMLSLLASCGNIKGNTAENQPHDQINNNESSNISSDEAVYTSEAYNYTLRLPKDIYESCEAVESDNEVYFSPLDESDMVMALVTVPDGEYSGAGQAGVTFLGSKNGYSTYLQLPTCGTLDNESLRETLEKLVSSASEITYEDFSFTNVK